MGLLAGACLTVSLILPIQSKAQNTAPLNSGAAPPARGPAETLYLQLRSVGLDKSRVYHIRETSIDRAAIHITLDDGTIAFTQDVGGHITGAFFEGEAEVLLTPPNQVERASMSVFTGAAILEERFSTAYFRFNDDTFAELQSKLRPTEQAEEFTLRWNEAARNLAPMDALRILVGFNDSLPDATAKNEVLWHARLQGRKLGTFDLYYDSSADEQIWAGQNKIVQGDCYFDIWTSFALDKQGKNQRVIGGTVNHKLEDFDVSHYKILTTINMPSQLSAEAWLRLNVHKDGLRALPFELSRFLQVKQVEADGHPVEFIHNQAVEGTQLARLGNDQIAVLIPRPLRAGQDVTLHFVYSGDVLSDAGGGLVYVGARGSWYPNRRPAMSDFDLEFRYPTGWTLIATGKKSDVPASPGETHDGEQVSRWVSERPLPVAGFNLGKYERAVARAGEVQVETYASKDVEKTFPRNQIELDSPDTLIPSGLRHTAKPLEFVLPTPSPARNAQKVADSAAQAVEFFSHKFGPYPYSTLSMTQRPGIMSQGWPGVVFLSSFSYLSEEEKSQLHMGAITRTLSSGVIAHETAHQWWGDLITWGGYRDQWLVEALADYSSLMFLETQNPAKFRAVLESYRNDLLLKNKDGEIMMTAGPVTLGDRLSSSHFPKGYEIISYERGVWLFHMLRNMLLDAERRTARSKNAEDPFLRTMRIVRDRYAGRPITTNELISAFEEELPRPLWHEGHKSLDWFHETWINGTAVPRFELDEVKFADQAGPSLMVTGKIIQKDAPESLITLIPVYGVVAGKNVLLGQVFSDEQEVHFRLPAPEGTRKVILDPNRTVLSRGK
jgi:hypothetical protein